MASKRKRNTTEQKWKGGAKVKRRKTKKQRKQEDQENEAFAVSLNSNLRTRVTSYANYEQFYSLYHYLNTGNVFSTQATLKHMSLIGHLCELLEN